MNELHKFSLSCMLFDDRDVLAGLDATAKAGFVRVELDGGVPFWAEKPRTQVVTQVRQRIDQLGIFPSTFHLTTVGLFLGALDEGWRQISVETLAEQIRLCGDLGVPTAILHPTYAGSETKDQLVPASIGRVIENSMKSVLELIPVAEIAGVQLALENLPKFGTHRPMERMVSLRIFMADMPRKTVGLCADVGHALLEGMDPAEEILTAGDRLFAIHLQDTDGEDDRHWVPSEGEIDWEAVDNALTKVQYQGAWTFEVSCREGVKGVRTRESVATLCADVARRWPRLTKGS